MRFVLCVLTSSQPLRKFGNRPANTVHVREGWVGSEAAEMGGKRNPCLHLVSPHKVTWPISCPYWVLESSLPVLVLHSPGSPSTPG
ncbi:hypothetical protein E2C01_051882 [Portunus trituberculatus]|uniref:Uncharacterized protein n=1 Tax=Portunus trituberculatus TaxID=210409 RepID=A0A5B7GG29_PORTR|nr:hypothetical protein [Portunus trituberculatus]